MCIPVLFYFNVKKKTMHACMGLVRFVRFVRFISGLGQVYKRFRNLLFCNLIGQFKLVMVEHSVYIAEL